MAKLAYFARRRAQHLALQIRCEAGLWACSWQWALTDDSPTGQLARIAVAVALALSIN